MLILIAIISYLLSLGILYIIRLYLTRNRLYVGDTFFHLLISKSIRQNRWKFPNGLRNVTFEECNEKYNYLAYPPLFHYVTALSPVKFHLAMAKNLNLFILSFITSIATVFVYNLTLNIGLSMFSIFVTVFTIICYDLVSQFSPRPLGLLFYSITICILVLYPQNLFSLLIISIFVALISLTHKFALQALLFGFLFYAIIFSVPYILLSFAFGLLLSTIISRGFYPKILREHLSWLLFYKNRRRKSDVVASLKKTFSRNFWILQIAFSILIFLSQKNASLLNDNIFIKVTFWAFINIFLSLIVSVPALSFLGEHYRYVEYSMLPVGISASMLMASLNPYIWLFSSACIVLSFLALIKFRKYLENSQALTDPDDTWSYNSLRNYDLSNLLVFPSVRTLEVNYFTDISVIHAVRGAEKTPSEHIANITSKHNIRYILKFKGSDRYRLFATMKEMIKMRKIADFKNFELYKTANEKCLITAN